MSGNPANAQMASVLANCEEQLSLTDRQPIVNWQSANWQTCSKQAVYFKFAHFSKMEPQFTLKPQKS